MGCSGSKAEQPLVVFCRERRDLIHAAANHRYTFASDHVSYFWLLKGVGDALQKFVDEELITVESSPSSPSLTLPRNSKQDNADEVHLQDDDDDDSHLHLSDSSSEDYDHHLHDSGDHHGRGSEDDMRQHHHNIPRNNHHGHFREGKKDYFDDDVSHVHSEEESSSNFHPQGGFTGYGNGYGNGYGDETYSNSHHYPNPNQDPNHPYGEPYMGHWDPQAAAGHYPNNSNVHYMKKGAPAAHTVIQEPPPEPSYGYSDSYFYPGVGFGYPGNNGYVSNENVRVNQEKEPPPPPSPPKASTWEFLNPFDEVNNNEYYSSGRYGYRSDSSSPDSTRVREREGIPDLEEETESETLKGKKWKTESKRDHSNYNSEDSSSRKFPLPKKNGKSKQVPMFFSESSSKSVPSLSSEENVKPYKGADNAKKMYTPSVLSPHSEGTSCVESPSGEIDSSIGLTDGSSSPEISVMETIAKRKGVSFEVGEASRQEGGVSFEAGQASSQEGDPSKLSSVTPSSPCGTRDLKEVVAEVRNEFQTAAGYGKEVALMLEYGKIPYQPSFLKAILSQKLYPISPSLSSRDPPSMQSAKLASKTVKLAKTYFDDVGKDENAEACNLSSTLDKLYAWEEKLYKEVKEGEKDRKMYEKLSKRLDNLVKEGAEPSKIDAALASKKRLRMNLDVNLGVIKATSTRIEKLRDEELQPRVAALIHGLIRMWNAMFKCHQKQFKAVMESKIRRLKGNTSVQTETTSRATTELERELRAWCGRFNNWIASQKSYVESLNGWLLHCIVYEPEVTPDGPVPYSPGHLKAPPVFVICNDWHQQMNAVSEVQVANAMNTFAMTLRELWEKQDEEGRQRRKAEFLRNDYEKQLEQLKQEAKTIPGYSMVASDHSGVSRMDDLKVDCDSMWQQLIEKKEKHRNAMNSVHEAAWSSLQGGLFPIFKALEVFSSEALKAHEQVRLQQPGLSS